MRRGVPARGYVKIRVRSRAEAGAAIPTAAIIIRIRARSIGTTSPNGVATLIRVAEPLARRADVCRPRPVAASVGADRTRRHSLTKAPVASARIAPPARNTQASVNVVPAPPCPIQLQRLGTYRNCGGTHSSRCRKGPRRAGALHFAKVVTAAHAMATTRICTEAVTTRPEQPCRRLGFIAPIDQVSRCRRAGHGGCGEG